MTLAVGGTLNPNTTNQHKCLQQLQLLAMHLDMLGYILGLLNGFGYLRKTGDLLGDNLTYGLTYGLLRKIFELDVPRKLTDDTENNFRGLILTVGKRVRKLWVNLESVQKKQHVT